MNVKFQHGAHFVKSRNAGSPRVEMESSPNGDLLHQQNVTVTTNEEIWSFPFELGKNAFGITRWASADVGHPDVQSACLEARMFRPGSTSRVVVDVAVDSPAWGHVIQCIGHAQISDVAGMPYLVRPLHMPEDALVDVSVGVGEEGDLHDNGLL